jgi:hypothetical protein
MTETKPTIRLYTAQRDVVINSIMKNGTSFSLKRYVENKYKESAPVFITAYTWFAAKAHLLCPQPPGAEFPYWSFHDAINVDTSGANLLTLDVPRDQAVFFDMYDWIKILQLNYLSLDEAKSLEFKEKLKSRGLNETEVMTTSFYPDLKMEIMASWDILFQHHEDIAKGKEIKGQNIQAALWQIKKEWIVKINE